MKQEWKIKVENQNLRSITIEKSQSIEKQLWIRQVALTEDGCWKVWTHSPAIQHNLDLSMFKGAADDSYGNCYYYSVF
jgi:hypothetical protein